MESILLEDPAVVEAIAYGKSNALMGNVVVAGVVLSSSENITEVEGRLIARCKARLAAYKVPVAVLSMGLEELMTHRQKKNRRRISNEGG